jgi:multimeric flavodoxin WrbA
MDEQNEYGDIPAEILAAIHRYVEYRDFPGTFLTYVLRGDLFNAYRTGGESLAALPAILGYLHWEVPGLCYGSPEKVSDWVAPPEPDNDTHTLLLNANARQLQSYLDAAHDIGAASTEGTD